MLYSKTHFGSGSIVSEISKLAGRRAPYHRKYLALCAFGATLSAPLTVIPVVPNIPMYYLLWRIWSHYKGAC